MINENLHKKAAALDRVQHRALRLDTGLRDLTTMRSLNAMFVASTEFGDACRDFPLVWVRAGNGADGKPQVAPIAVFGLQAGDNLCIDGEAWRTRYVPAALRLYPFAMARISNDQMVVAIDESWPGFQAERGELLLDEQGQPTEFMRSVQQQLETYEQEVERTRLGGEMLMAKGLLREMRFDATMPDGRKVTVDGFLAIDEQKLGALADADIVELHKSGLLGLIHAHQISMRNMERLAKWHAERHAAGARPATH